MVNIEEILVAWAEHAAAPFDGIERSSDVERAIKISLASACAMAAGVFPELKGMQVGYLWSDKNKISVHMDDISDDMLIVEL